jgi:hypothetical protein
MRQLLLFAWLCCGLVACGPGNGEEGNPGKDPNGTPVTDPYKATVTGSVGGISFGAADAVWTRSAREYVMVGEKLVGAGECLDVRAAPALLEMGFNGALRAGTHAVVSFMEAERTSGTYASLQNPSGNRFATGGSVTVSKDGERWSGSFELDFSGERLTGTFEMKSPALTQLCP